MFRTRAIVLCSDVSVRFLLMVPVSIHSWKQANTTFDVSLFILWSEGRNKCRPLRCYGCVRVLGRECRVMHEKLALDDPKLIEFLLLIRRYSRSILLYNVRLNDSLRK